MCNRLEGLHKKSPSLPFASYIKHSGTLLTSYQIWGHICVLAANVTKNDPSLKLRYVSEDVQVI